MRLSNKVEKLSERVNEVSRKVEADARKGPRQWFGFEPPQHSYDTRDVRFDHVGRHAWRYFCYLQMTGIELDEYMAISVWNTANGYPLVSYGVSPELRSQAETFHKRNQELEMTVQARAEELDRRDPEAYPRWKEFYRQLEESEEATDEPVGPVDDSLAGRIRSMWGWTLQVLETYRKQGGI
jgi:hypothetical protein